MQTTTAISEPAEFAAAKLIEAAADWGVQLDPPTWAPVLQELIERWGSTSAEQQGKLAAAFRTLMSLPSDPPHRKTPRRLLIKYARTIYPDALVVFESAAGMAIEGQGADQLARVSPENIEVHAADFVSVEAPAAALIVSHILDTMRRTILRVVSSETSDDPWSHIRIVPPPRTSKNTSKNRRQP